jgi:uncharacterized membrane protein YdjX (TVP38/TMEM64 family)
LYFRQATQLIQHHLPTILYTLFLGIMPLLGSSLLTYWAISQEDSLRQADSIVWSGLFLISIFTMAFALTPTTFVALLSGYFLGWEAVLPVVTSYWIASWVGYRAAQRLDNGMLWQWLNQQPKVATFIEKLHQNDLALLILCRLSPALPFAIMNMVFALTHTRLRLFLTAGFVGMLPRTLLFIWVGKQELSWMPLITIGLMVLSVDGIVVILKRILRK